MTIIKKLTVTTDDERIQWIEMLKLASDYHFDMAGQFHPTILGDNKMVLEDLENGLNQVLYKLFYWLK